MPFKINISDKGKTFQVETESEIVVGKSIGEQIKGEDISPDLEGYELEITGTSDASGFPSKKGLEGAGYHRELLTHGFGMKNTQKGLRLRKTLRGQEISLKTSQVNTKVIKEGNKKLGDLAPKKEKEKPVAENQATNGSSKKPITNINKKQEKFAEEKKEEPKTDTDKEKPTEEAPKEETIKPAEVSQEEPIKDSNKKE